MLSNLFVFRRFSSFDEIGLVHLNEQDGTFHLTQQLLFIDLSLIVSSVLPTISVGIHGPLALDPPFFDEVGSLSAQHWLHLRQSFFYSAHII